MINLLNKIPLFGVGDTDNRKSNSKLNAKIAEGVVLLKQNLDIQLEHIESHMDRYETLSDYEKTYWKTYKVHVESTCKIIDDILAGKLCKHA